MAYQLIPDILGAIILAATFILCLRSFRREDHRHAQSLCDTGGAPSTHEAGVSNLSLGEVLNLMDRSVGRTVRAGHSPITGAAEGGAARMAGVKDRPGAGEFMRHSSASVQNDLEGIEVTVRVNTQRISSAAGALGMQDVVNAEWEPVYPEVVRARRPATSVQPGVVHKLHP